MQKWKRWIYGLICLIVIVVVVGWTIQIKQKTVDSEQSGTSQSNQGQADTAHSDKEQSDSTNKGQSDSAQSGLKTTGLTLWQIDSFEGGKGSRAKYLQTLADAYFIKTGEYVQVESVSYQAALTNLQRGNVPSLLSYGAGLTGLESYLSDVGEVWCRGSYCFLTLDEHSDFSDVNADNTVVNLGKENLANVAAVLCGLNGAKLEESTVAYTKLIANQYQYLLGTQRDVWRLKTRGVNFYVKPISLFNDLYQIISVTTACKDELSAKNFVAFVVEQKSKLTQIGLFYKEDALYEDADLRLLATTSVEYRLDYALSNEAKSAIENCLKDNDVNRLKMYLKLLKK